MSKQVSDGKYKHVLIYNEHKLRAGGNAKVGK